ncbi:MAG: hypothetical protein Fur0032_01650 [Terrimicrobiaceae bacterium]
MNWSARDTLRGLGHLWRKRKNLPQLLNLACHDDWEPATLSAARRLTARGHSLTARTGKPTDASGNPIPWYTYPFLDYIAGWETSDWAVLEFGSGQSTLYWAARTARVIAYESKMEWFERNRQLSPANVELRHFAGPETLAELAHFPAVPRLVIIDGWCRMHCAAASLKAFGTRPLYILDNSDWLPQACTTLRDAGLMEFRFHGFGPVNGYAWATSLFASPESLALLRLRELADETPGGLPAGDYELQDLA